MCETNGAKEFSSWRWTNRMKEILFMNRWLMIQSCWMKRVGGYVMIVILIELNINNLFGTSTDLDTVSNLFRTLDKILSSLGRIYRSSTLSYGDDRLFWIYIECSKHRYEVWKKRWIASQEEISIYYCGLADVSTRENLNQE